VKHWHLAVPSAYGRAPEAAVADGALVLKRLHPAGYIGLHQAVNIRQGKNYRLTFEARGTPGEWFLVMVRDPGKKAHVSRRVNPSETWEAVSVQFTGAFDTDEDWVSDWLKATENSRLEDGRTVNQPLRKISKSDSDTPTRSWLSFALGKLEGEFAIRNVSLVAIDSNEKE
jgi:hypothetical protein